MKYNPITDPKVKSHMIAFTRGMVEGLQMAMGILESEGLTPTSLWLIKQHQADLKSDDGISGDRHEWPAYDADAEVNLLGPTK